MFNCCAFFVVFNRFVLSLSKMRSFTKMYMASEEYRRIGNWLKRSRRSMIPEVSQRQVAIVAGVSPNTYRKWENGESAPDVIQLQRIQAKYGWKSTPNC